MGGGVELKKLCDTIQGRLGTKETAHTEQNRQAKGQLCRLKTVIVIKEDNLKTKSKQWKKKEKGKALRKQIPLMISDVLQKHCTILPNHVPP